VEDHIIHIDVTMRLHSATGEMTLAVKTELQLGEFVTLYGPSGAGKTTLLRLLSGLTSPDNGSIRFGNSIWFDKAKNINLSAQQRTIGFMFQDYALFPNMTVRKNLEYALQKNESHEIIDELISVMEIEQLQDKKPQALSGGQQQRVALARALVRKPKLLLLDEPLSALDKEMRYKLQEYIVRVHKQFHLTTILVSHDLPEIYKLSDTVITLESGKIIKQGSVSELFLKKQKGSEIILSGEILAIEPNGNTTILLGDTIVNVTIPEIGKTPLKPGDRIGFDLGRLSFVEGKK